MKTFVYFVINPFFLFWLMIVIGILYYWRTRRIVFLLLGLGWLFLIGVSPFPQWLISSLERQYPSQGLKTSWGGETVNILILGGGHTLDDELPAIDQLSHGALSRLAEGIRLQRQIPGSLLICSGNSLSGSITQAEILASAAVSLGVSERDTVQMRYPKNTAEELQAYKRQFGQKTRFFLVTSAFHMSRALLLCEKEGLAPIAAPADFFLKKQGDENAYDFEPSATKIQMTHTAFHEFAGILRERFIE